MTSAQIARLTFGLIFLVILFISGRNYFEYRRIIAEDKPVHYKVVNTSYSIGKGRSYNMELEYNGKTYSTEINAEIADNIEKGDYPVVYYVQRKDKLITEWHVVFSRRIALLSAAVIVICSLPIGKVIKKEN